MVPYTFRERQPNQQPQSNKRTRNDAEGGTLQNPPFETPHAPEEQPTSRESFGSINDLGNASFIKVILKRGRSQRTLIRIRKFREPQESTSTRINNDVLDTVQEQLQEGESSTILNDVPNTVQENPPSNDESADEHPILSKLNPPSRSDQFKTKEAYLKLLQEASYLASKIFALLDSIGVDYLALYEGVHSIIRQQCDKEALHKQKPLPAFTTKAEHEQVIFGFSNNKETKSEVDSMVKDAEGVFASEMSFLALAEEEVKKRKEIVAKREATLAALQAKKVVSDKVYYESELKAKNIAPKMSEAQVLIDYWERRWNETNDRLNRAKDELSRLKM